MTVDLANRRQYAELKSDDVKREKSCNRNKGCEIKMKKYETQAEIEAQYARNISFDLSSPEWQCTKTVDLVLLKPDTYHNWPEAKQHNVGTCLREKASAKLLWNEKYLAVGVEMEDSDVVAEGKADQTHLYAMGDIVEVFVKPLNANYYWEFYGTPNNLKTVFFYPSRGYLFLPSCATHKPEIEVVSKVFGTLNDWTKKDVGWNMTMKIPLSILTRYGLNFQSGEWTIMIGRQNYSAYLPLKEESSFPALSSSDFHLYEEYALIILKGGKK